MRRVLVSFVLFAICLSAHADWCATGPSNDARLRSVHERRARGIAANRLAPDGRTTELRDGGTFLVPNDETLTPGYHPFDLDGTSLVLTPSASGFVAKRMALQYRQPSTAAAVDFESTSELFVARDLAFPFPIFGRSITRIYVSAANGITFEEPVKETALQFDVVEAAVHRSAILSPLLLTEHRPATMQKPRAFIEEREGAVVVTWRADGGSFPYDVQAELTAAGGITFSYRTVSMRWGTPIVAPGFDPKSVQRTVGYSLSDTAGVTTEVPDAIRPMVDLRKVEIVSFDDTELFAVRLTLEGPIDASKLEEDRTIGFLVALQNSIGVDDVVAGVELTRDEVRLQPFNHIGFVPTSAAVFLDGNVIEFYGRRAISPATSAMVRVAAATYSTPYAFYVDQAGDFGQIPFAKRSAISDLSAVTESGTPIVGPVSEPFTLGVFDPMAVWETLQDEWGLSDADFDAVAMYQNFHTDLIFYAGAYAMTGNPQVDGVTFEGVPGYGTSAPRRPTLMHMNHLTYGFSSAERSASQVMLHELGHRWLYYLEVELPSEDDRVLNPVTAHPAAYVHTPSAFPLHGANEASVMGGGFFTPLGGNSYRATAANYGYSWTDLYAMGLADAAEVPPWFFVKGTTLPLQYFPPDGITVSGTRKDVTIDHVRSQLGFRVPDVSLSDRTFRVLFVLVTEAGRPATDEDLATIRLWRSVLERDFALATGGRASVRTSFARAAKRRGVR